ncbi:MAG: hypothetical protein NZM11_10560 [Anaerolineales bacterium]|nr:hypothetical protein [Anaerolineales bacterium]
MVKCLEQLKIWWTERRVKLRNTAVNVQRAFALVWDVHRPSALAMLACTLVGSLLLAAQSLVGMRAICQRIGKRMSG